MNINKFKGKIIEKGLSVSEVARKRGEHPSTLYRKMKSGKVTFQDVEFYVNLLELSPRESKDIFL